MEEKRITIDSVKPATKQDGTVLTGTGRNGKPWSIYSVKDTDGKWHKCFGEFNKHDVPLVREGKTYDVELEIDEQYHSSTIKKARELHPDTQAETASPAPPTQPREQPVITPREPVMNEYTPLDMVNDALGILGKLKVAIQAKASLDSVSDGAPLTPPEEDADFDPFN